MSISPKIRMALAGLTAVALMGGVMVAGPAEAGKKKRKKGHSVKVVQVSKGGKAKAGNGGNGGKGGNSGNVYNTGDVGGNGDPGVPADGRDECVAEELDDRFDIGDNRPPRGQIRGAVDPCFPGPPGHIPRALVTCLQDAFNVTAPPRTITAMPTEAEINACLGANPVPDGNGGNGGGGVVRSGDAGNGGDGGAGGDARGGAGGDNASTVGISSSHSSNGNISVDD